MVEETFILCSPADGPPNYITPGSKVYECCDCGQRVIAAPSSQDMINREGAKVICLDCAGERARIESGLLLRMLPGALQEIRNYLHRQ